MITANQLRSARALLNWTQQDLAKRSGVSEDSIREIESGKAEPRKNTLHALIRAIDDAGVNFIMGDSPGVKFKFR